MLSGDEEMERTNEELENGRKWWRKKLNQVSVGFGVLK